MMNQMSSHINQINQLNQLNNANKSSAIINNSAANNSANSNLIHSQHQHFNSNLLPLPNYQSTFNSLSNSSNNQIPLSNAVNLNNDSSSSINTSSNIVKKSNSPVISNQSLVMLPPLASHFLNNLSYNLTGLLPSNNSTNNTNNTNSNNNKNTNSSSNSSATNSNNNTNTNSNTNTNNSPNLVSSVSSNNTNSLVSSPPSSINHSNISFPESNLPPLFKLSHDNSLSYQQQQNPQSYLSQSLSSNSSNNQQPPQLPQFNNFSNFSSLQNFSTSIPNFDLINNNSNSSNSNAYNTTSSTPISTTNNSSNNIVNNINGNINDNNNSSSNSNTTTTNNKNIINSSTSGISKPNHLPRKKRLCSICNNHFSNLTTHKKIHEEDVKPYTCSTCQRPFKRLNDLMRHEKCHLSQLGQYEFQCPFHPGVNSVKSNRSEICHHTGYFTRCDTYKNHLKAIHFRYPPNTLKNDRLKVNGNCRECGEFFKNVQDWLVNHIENNQCPKIINPLQKKIKHE